MRLFYTIGIWFYILGIRIAALFGHGKARLMVKGWKAVGCPWSAAPGEQVAWFHAASLGEFEQARPVLEEYKRRHPDHRIVVTFFSPSGYEVRKNYAQADAVLYLPPDLPCTVRRFLDRYRPTVAFFVKYEFWYNYLGALHRRGIPTYIFSAIFRPNQYFFKGVPWFRNQLRDCFNHLFVQNEESLNLLKSIGIEHCSVAGDTRFDRVHQIAVAAEGNEVVERFLDGHQGKVLVAGSTWPPDEALITQAIRQSDNQAIRLILAPHVISEEHLKQIEALFPDSVRYSQVASGQWPEASNVLIIDNIGLLSKLYRYADVAYIGGGFGVGIHNILEAVTFGKPVLFGPNYHKFQEAKDIIARGGGFSHHDGESLNQHLQPLLTDPEAYAKASQACLDYMTANLGSTEKILSTIDH
ncbi:MAG: 3-deoxy-D-manno-octulosonic acid transferase [Bacteroidales bacterium]|nr:3-deoxy-D-manno-octulosonic acid transferase [Bacteroidales bacterium]